MTLHKNLSTPPLFSFKLVLACVISFCFTNAIAQFYPVQVTPQLVPPYSVYLSDYATPGSEKLRVIILQRDLTQPAYQLRLMMTVELNGRIIMRTARSFNPRPISLEPGVPTIISGSDLSPYLDSRNIDFVGYSREQYEKKRALPEGSYRIIFTAYDYRRQDVQVSSEGSSYYYLSKNEPPLINFPACGSKIQIKEPQQIVFSWLPRNTASPTSAAETEYEFTMYETRPEGRNPNDVVLSTQPVFRVRTDFPQFVYGLVEPMLIENMKYVWRVQAIDKNGKDAFRNNGFSEVCTFNYSTSDGTFDVGVVKNLQAVGETERRGKISWEASNYDSYKVYYKKTSPKEGEYEWFWSNVKTTELKLFDLEPDTEYETRVQVKKNGAFGPYSEIVKFRTLPKRAADCGQQDQPFAKADESKPLQNAIKGMIIDVDDMELTLKETISLGGGWFKGMGTVTTKLLGASFHVKFERLFIDENHVAGNGRIDFITKGVADLVQQQLANQQPKSNRLQWADVLFQPKIFKYDIAIAEVELEDEAFIITGIDGNTSTNNEIYTMLKDAPEKAIIIEDKNGEQWVAQKDTTTGETKVTKVSGGGLVVGPDGKIIDTKTLRKLNKMIREALIKYEKVIEEYQASIKDVKPGKGGGPSLSEEELEMFLLDLPSCLEEYKEHLSTISTNIKTYLDSSSNASKEFGVEVAEVLTSEFPTDLDKDNAPSEKVEKAVCVALIGKLFKTFFNSKYVIVNKGLLVEAWASTKKNDQFTQDIVSDVDSKLAVLDKNGNKTLILIKHTWFDQNVLNSLNSEKQSIEQKLEDVSASEKDSLAKELGKTDFNLLIVLYAKYDAALAEGFKGVSFREYFYPMDGLDPSCTKSVKDYITSSARKKFSDGLNDALKERAEKLGEKLSGCKVEKPKEIVIHYKRKGRNKYRTWGEFTIVGTDYKGYILERPRGDNPTEFEIERRVPAGSYSLSYSEYSGGDIKFDNVTLYLIDHPRYKLHCGNRVDQSNGCLLINDFSPQNDKYPDAFEDDYLRGVGVSKANVANSYPPKPKPHSQPTNPALKLRKKVEELQKQIEKLSKVSTVTKTLIVDESEEKEEP